MSPYGVPMPQGAPAPQGVPMGGPYGGAAPAAPAVMPGAAPQASIPLPALPAGPSMLPPNLRPQTIGQNGFGIHPEVSHEELANYLFPKVKSVESSHDYTNYIGKAEGKPQDPTHTASGAYGYIDSTWNHYKGYPRAMDAPPEVQDERMKQDTIASLQRFGGDPFKTLANHYHPAFAQDPTKWEQPITDKYGKVVNPQSVRQYLEKVLPAERVGKYMSALGDSGTAQGGTNAPPI